MQYAEYFTTSQLTRFKHKALYWAQSFSTHCYLDNNGYRNYPYQKYEGLIAAGSQQPLKCQPGKALQQLEQFQNSTDDWCFGFLSYELKNEVENLQSDNFDGVGMPALHFFIPQHLIQILGDDTIRILSQHTTPQKIWKSIQSTSLPATSSGAFINQPLENRITKKEYIDTIKALQDHIAQGDVYEINFCQEFYSSPVTFPAPALFWRMNADSPSPFSAFYKLKDKYLLCTSPERFLKRKGRKLISQPIKGTIKRGTTPKEDQQLIQQLKKSEKDQAENVMIVDLVRNDLAKNTLPGSVQVEELFGIYTFPKVHHMISTITGQIEAQPTLKTLLKSTFPMGSMTGAPKYTAMKLIEEYEKTKRGLYSGAVGYISPEGDFDFNVVIRSLLYNKSHRYMSYQAGGAITYDSDPEAEYEESLLKAEGIFELLSATRSPTPP